MNALKTETRRPFLSARSAWRVSRTAVGDARSHDTSAEIMHPPACSLDALESGRIGDRAALDAPPRPRRSSRQLSTLKSRSAGRNSPHMPIAKDPKGLRAARAVIISRLQVARRSAEGCKRV